MPAISIRSKNVAVLGSGAIGQLYGACFILAGARVCFIARSDANHLKNNGLHIQLQPTKDLLPARIASSIHIPPHRFQVAPTPAHAAVHAPFDLILLAIKTTALPQTPEMLHALCSPTADVICMCNGLGAEDMVATAHPQDRIYGALCQVCVNRTHNGPLVHIAHGNLLLGHYLDQPAARSYIGSLFSAAGISNSLPPSLLCARWIKLIWNIPFNGLCTVTRPNGSTTDQILGSPSDRLRILELMNEVIHIGNADLAHAGQAARIDPDHWIAEMIQRTQRMGPYQPSTLIDYRAGRPMELDAIFFEAQRRARKLGVPCPHLDRLCNQLCTLRVA